MDPQLIENPKTFDGFRFSKMRERVSTGITQGFQWSTSNLHNMAFGYGRHACPGRHFADLEIKQIMVHLLMNYDFRFGPENETRRPASLKAETQVVPNQQARILMRKRRA